MEKTQIIILAAGHGKRMQSETPKALTLLKGKPFIKHLLDTIDASGVCDDPIIVIRQKGDQLKDFLGDKYTYAIQAEQLGTGHAVMSAKDYVDPKSGIVVVLSADQPLVSKETIQKIVKTYKESKSIVTLGTVLLPDFEDWRKWVLHLGRIIRNEDNRVIGIIEYKDADKEQKKIMEINPALYAFDSKWLWKNINKIKNKNVQGEYYLTDLVKIASEEGEKIEAVQLENIIELFQPNSKSELEVLEAILKTENKDKAF